MCSCQASNYLVELTIISFFYSDKEHQSRTTNDTFLSCYINLLSIHITLPVPAKSVVSNRHYSMFAIVKIGVPHSTYIGVPHSYPIGLGHSPVADWGSPIYVDWGRGILSMLAKHQSYLLRGNEAGCPKGIIRHSSVQEDVSLLYTCFAREKRPLQPDSIKTKQLPRTFRDSWELMYLNIKDIQ